MTSELESLRQIDSELFKAHTIDITWPVAEGTAGLDAALERISREADEALVAGVNIIILSDRMVGLDRVAIPALLAVSSVHHHLVREGTRLQAGLVIESGEPRDVHQFATLIGYGAAAINPYVMLETLVGARGGGLAAGGDDRRRGAEARDQGDLEGPPEDDLEDGDLDDPVLLRRADLRGGRPRHGRSSSATSPARRRGSAGSAPRCSRARRSTGTRAPTRGNGDLLPLGGVYAWRNEGEYHQWNPETIALLQHAVRHGGYASYEQFSRLVNEDAVRRATLRGLLRFNAGQRRSRSRRSSRRPRS